MEGMTFLRDEPSPHFAGNGNLGRDIEDERLQRAYNEAVEANNVLPLLKEELKLRIQARRLSEGKEELLVTDPEPERVYPLTEEERVKMMERKHRNRVSATLHRQKSKQHMEALHQRLWEAEKKNENLKSEIRKMKEKIQKKSKQSAVGQSLPPGKKATFSTSTAQSPSVGVRKEGCAPSTSGTQQSTLAGRNSVGSQTETFPVAPKRKVSSADGGTAPTSAQEHAFVKIRFVPQYVVLTTVTTQDRKESVGGAGSARIESGEASGRGAQTPSSPGISRWTLLSAATGSNKPGPVQSSSSRNSSKTAAPSRHSRPASSTASTAGVPQPVETSSKFGNGDQRAVTCNALPVMVTFSPTCSSQQEAVVLEGVNIASTADSPIIGVKLQPI